MLNVLMIATTDLRNLDQLDAILPLPDDFTVSDGEYVIEFAGRGCYQSWDRPNPETAHTRDYVSKNIIGKNHGSVLEHVNVTFYVTGVSRSLTHELIRHRHLSYSELSQRYVDMETATYVQPPALRDQAKELDDYDQDEDEQDWIDSPFFQAAREAYQDIGTLLDVGANLGAKPVTGKRRREAQRAAMPNSTETRITITGNLRAWRHVIAMRGSLDADAEIREFAVEVFRQLSTEYPSVFPDMEVRMSDDGREYVGWKSITPAAMDGAKPFREWTAGDLGIASAA